MRARHDRLLDPDGMQTGRLVTLLDGTQVDSASEAWRHECLVRELARWPLDKRRAYLNELDRKQPALAATYRKTLTQLWKARTHRNAP